MAEGQEQKGEFSLCPILYLQNLNLVKVLPFKRNTMKNCLNVTKVYICSVFIYLYKHINIRSRMIHTEHQTGIMP